MTAFSITICLPIRGAAHYVCYPGTTSAAEFMRHPQIFGRCESDTPMADNGKIACLLGAVHTPHRCRLSNIRPNTTRPLGGSSTRLTFQVLFTGVQQVNLLPLYRRTLNVCLLVLLNSFHKYRLFLSPYCSSNEGSDVWCH